MVFLKVLLKALFEKLKRLRLVRDKISFEAFCLLLTWRCKFIGGHVLYEKGRKVYHS
jgi:hypothetical protein